MLQTEFPFTLPCGYEENGTLHKEGVMRLANANDEIAPMKDPRVQSNHPYLMVIVLSRVVTKLGDLSQVNPKVIENMYVPDIRYLQELYHRVNETGSDKISVKCPHCDTQFEMETNGPGE